MPSEPSYPKDAAPGDAKLNETLSHAVTAKEAERNAAEADKPKGSTRSFVRGAAVGVGSAALVAALLYANSRRSSADKSGQARGSEENKGSGKPG